MGAAALCQPGLAAGRVGGRLLLGGVELGWREHGAGPPLLLLHETATSGAVWERLTEAIAADARVLVPDRRGWGESVAPEHYRATTVEEQAADALALLEHAAQEPAVACGAGLGAVAALELLLRCRDRVRAAVLVEPPLLAFLPEATEGLASDRERLGQAVHEGGPPAAVELYLRGALPHLGPGAERIPESLAEGARQRPFSLFAELGAVPGWALRAAEMRSLEAPSVVVVADSSPALLRQAAERLAPSLGGSRTEIVEARGLPQIGAAPRLAELIRELL